MIPKKNKGIERILRACLYTRDGLLDAFKTEAAFRQECLLAVILIPLAFYLAPDRAFLAMMLGSVFLVLVVELLNTAIEAVVDKTGTDIHPLAKKAKDAGSAAVFIALTVMALIWALAIL